MKKYLFIFLTIILVACENNLPEIDPPELSVSPDTIVNISTLNSAKFQITGFSSEDLITFSVSTTPYFENYDTIFPSFTHNIVKEIKFILSEVNMPVLTEDSLINVSFKLSDNFNTTEIKRTLRVVDDYPKLLVDSSYLVCLKDSSFFYSFQYLRPFNFIEISDFSFDLVALYDDDFGFVLASPDANFISQKLVEFTYFYNTTGKQHTSLSRVSLDFNDITPQFLQNMSPNEQFINDNGSNGVGVTLVHQGDVITYYDDNEKKGAILITEADINTKRLSFTFKYQN